VGGEADSAAYGRDLIRRLAAPNVEFLGKVDGGRFLPSIDVLVVPSLWQENSPRVVYEAFAHGVPVICSNRGGMPELVENGTTGFVFEPERPEQLAELVDALAGRREQLRDMSARCLEAAARLRPEATTAGYLDAYRAVMSA